MMFRVHSNELKIKKKLTMSIEKHIRIHPLISYRKILQRQNKKKTSAYLILMNNFMLALYSCTNGAFLSRFSR